MNKQLNWLFILSAAIYFIQGIEGLPGLSLFLYLKEQLHFDASTIMYITSLTTLAWLIKPVWGYLCDNFLSKKKWILLSLIGSILVSLYFGLSPLMSIAPIIILSLLGNWNAAIRDVACDGMMCVEGKKENECGRIQAIQWTAITVASVLVGLGGGYISDNFNYKLAYLSLIPIYLIIVGLVSRFKTVDATQGENSRGGRTIQTLLSYRELFTNKKFLLGCLFVFLYNFNPSFGTPLMFIERDSFHWSGTFMGVLSAIMSAVGIIGSVLYFKFGKKLDVRKWLTYSVFIGATTTLCYLYFTPVTAVVYGTLFSLVGMFVFLNVMAWMAQATIPGKEATSFALLCSVNNLAGTASTISGAYLFPKIGLEALIVVSAFTSFLCLPLIRKVGFDEKE